MIEARDTLLLLGVSRQQALQKLHALNDAGQLQIGVDAFILIWQQLPYWRALARVLQLPLLK
ncbi:MAG: DCC1-like thiol-disulfide oxidoreductase family protein [Pseudomonadales bacterium]